MKDAEFEEKEYELPLYRQLGQNTLKLWPPGLVLEGYLGFDLALLLLDPYFWRLHGISRPLAGVSPWHQLWPILKNKQWQQNRLPRFRCNCFIQAKRPKVGSRLPKKLGSLGTARPFFRFSIESDQQELLETAAFQLAGRALFTYAAPVFSRSSELFRHMTLGTIVSHSTFPDVLTLEGQHAWYYNQPGAVGVANRSFEPLEMPSLAARVEILIGEHRNSSEREQSPSAALAQLAGDLRGIVERVGATGEWSRAAYLADELRRISALTEQFDVPPAVVSYLQVDAFATYCNLTWLTIS